MKAVILLALWVLSVVSVCAEQPAVKVEEHANNEDSIVFVPGSMTEPEELTYWRSKGELIERVRTSLRDQGVNPIPAGCIFFAFIVGTTPQPVVRDAEGKINAVITPIGRRESLRIRWEFSEFEEAVKELEANRQKDPMYGANCGLPVGDSWKSMRASLRPSDEIWTFGFLDVGTVVIRDGRVVCLVVTEHQW